MINNQTITTATAVLTPEEHKKFNKDFSESFLYDNSKVTREFKEGNKRVTVSVTDSGNNYWEEILTMSFTEGFMKKKGWGEKFAIKTKTI